MALNHEQQDFWNAYVETLTTPPDDPKIEANIPGNEEVANELLSLFLEGKKTASSSLLKDYVYSGDPLPEIGNYWMILNKERKPQCIVQTVRIERNKFKDMTTEIAHAEGEGDLSLEHWRKVHIDFFTPFLKDWNVSNLEEEEVITEFFRLVYK